MVDYDDAWYGCRPTIMACCDGVCLAVVTFCFNAALIGASDN